MRSGLFKRIWDKVLSGECFDWAAQTSFYFVLSIVPFFLVLAVIVGWLPSSNLWGSLVGWIVRYVPAPSRRFVLSLILGLSDHSGGVLSLGLIASIWSAATGFMSLMQSFTAAYGAKDTRPYWRKRLFAIGLTLLATLFVLLAFAIWAFGHWGVDLYAADLKRLDLPWFFWDAIRWVVTFLLLTIGIDLANYLLPDVRRPWRWMSFGTGLAVVTLMAAYGLFELYFEHFSSYPKIYGAIGGFIILMLWIYVACVIVLLGAETDHELDELSGTAVSR